MANDHFDRSFILLRLVSLNMVYKMYVHLFLSYLVTDAWKRLGKLFMTMVAKSVMYLIYIYQNIAQVLKKKNRRTKNLNSEFRLA